MRLILCRHGDVLEAGDGAAWLARGDDPPLAPAGVEQALRLAAALSRARIRPAAVLSGPPRRMRQHAAIRATRLGLGGPPVIDERLSEIDCGACNGLSTREIEARCSRRHMDGWNRDGLWPSCGRRIAQQDAFRETVRAFTDGVPWGRCGSNGTVVAVTGHATLKCLGDLMRRRAGCDLPGAWRRVDPGNVCQLFYHWSTPHVVSWNDDPAAIRLGRRGPAGTDRR